MKKIMLIGKSECGKTSLTQALKGKTITYKKTQYVNHFDVVIDTPGEYAENGPLAGALALYSYEADVLGLLISATEEYSLYPPQITATTTRPVIGIVTQVDHPFANPKRAANWLSLAGCKEIFYVSAYTGEGIYSLLEYLQDDDDVLFCESKEEVKKGRVIHSTKKG